MEELLALFKWLLSVLAISLLMRPYLKIRNLKLWDGGFAFSFGLGTALSFFFCWIVSAIGLVQYDTPWVYISLIICSILGVIFQKERFQSNLTNDLRRYLCGFALFSAIFLLGIWIKGFHPEITSTTEQYMDYGFVQAIFRQKAAIPEDIWYSGENLNYYYLGQAACAYLCRLSFVLPEYGYPFMLYTIFASLFTMVFSLSHALVEGKRCFKIIGGIAASFMTTFAGNGHYVYYGIIVPIIEKVSGNMSLREMDYGYYFPDSTTYIGNNQIIPDFGKHEFPAYSFVLGDLHAHVINILFVIPLLVLLIDYVYDKNQEQNKNHTVTKSVNNAEKNREWLNVIEDIYDFRLVLIGVLFAVFMGSNYWDFPIYFIICGGVILFSDCHKNGITLMTIVKVLLKGVYMIITAYILAIPFNSHFTMMASNICLCENHSPIYKLLILWGFPIAVCVAFMIWLIKEKKDHDNLKYLMMALVPCIIGLIIMPEIVYVEDIYGIEYARFNTMFKLTYQAFILTGIVIGVAIGTWFSRKISCGGVILFSLVLLLSSYFGYSVAQYMGNIFDSDLRYGSNCCDFLMEDYELDPQLNAISIINRDPRTHIHILEAGGTSYQPDNMISVFTGAATYVGWGVHEWMWRNGWDPIGEREGNLSYFYSSGDVDYCSQFINDEEIDYIFVGPREYYYYDINPAGYENLSNVNELYRSEDNMYKLYSVKR